MVRLLHLADVHLGASHAPFGALAGERRAAVLAAFRTLPVRAAELKADAVLVAGDLYDGPRPGVEARAAAAEVFRRLREDGRPVLVVPGNHDSNLFHPNPWAEPPGGATVFQEPTFVEPVVVETSGGPLNVYGLAFDPAREDDPLSSYRRAARPGFHVVLLHGSVQDAPHWAGSRQTLRLLPDELDRIDADYVALGDYHRHRFVGGVDGGAAACYAGSFAAVDLTETGPRGFLTVDLNERSRPRVEHHDSGVTAVADVGVVDVGGAADEAAVVDAVVARAPADQVPVVTLEGVPAFPLDVEEVVTGLERRFGHARVVDRTSYFSSQRLDEIGSADTVAGHMVRLARRRIERATGERERRVADRALRIALRELGVD